VRGLRDTAPDDEPASATLADVPNLVARMRSEGLAISVLDEERLAPSTGDPLIDTSAFRIAQEALTNVVKHAPGACVGMTIRLENGQLLLDIRDDGGDRPGIVSSGSGLGLRGMHERVALHGGSLEAGPDGSGFRVQAVLPTRRAAP
jgi:signal transduction histidine kinase